jgi:hypothetical protein
MVKWLLTKAILKAAVRNDIMALQHKLKTGERLTNKEQEFIQRTYYDYKYSLATK